MLNGDPKAVSRTSATGAIRIGGPVGKPGGDNKLFFFFNQELHPRTVGDSVDRFRCRPTLERKGDFSQSRDNIGNLVPLYRDPRSTGLPCVGGATRRGCFQDGGVLGKIPADGALQHRASTC